MQGEMKNYTEKEFVSRTEYYLKVKKPLLERQRRARVNKCLEALKIIIAELQGDDAVLRLDKAELLDSTINFLRVHSASQRRTSIKTTSAAPKPILNSFCNGYMNAVGEVSRVMASVPGMDVNIGKAVMVRLGFKFNRLLKTNSQPDVKQENQLMQDLSIVAAITAPVSPASSGYLSDCGDNSIGTAQMQNSVKPSLSNSFWRPW